MRKILLASLLTVAAAATEYGFLDYYFVDPDHPIHLAGRFRQVGEAKFEKHHRGHLNYADAYGMAFYTQFLDMDNSLSWGLGYDYMKIGWEKNPLFSQENFNYVVGSLGYVSTTLEKWRWIVNGGFSVEANHLDFGQTGVWHGMLWGRYSFNNSSGWHMGILGWYGILNGYALPIFGVDWKMTQNITLYAIFPVNFSMSFALSDFWSIDVAYSGFGGPYRYPHRANGGKNGFHDPIFEIYSNGVDVNLHYNYGHLFRLAIGGGWDFGGWLFIKDHHNHHGKYYSFESAPYAQATISFTF
jgi:hypothetical protein